VLGTLNYKGMSCCIECVTLRKQNTVQLSVLSTGEVIAYANVSKALLRSPNEFPRSRMFPLPIFIDVPKEHRTLLQTSKGTLHAEIHAAVAVLAAI
jgi:hypothetical protein